MSSVGKVKSLWRSFQHLHASRGVWASSSARAFMLCAACRLMTTTAAAVSRHAGPGLVSCGSSFVPPIRFLSAHGHGSKTALQWYRIALCNTNNRVTKGSQRDQMNFPKHSRGRSRPICLAVSQIMALDLSILGFINVNLFSKVSSLWFSHKTAPFTNPNSFYKIAQILEVHWPSALPRLASDRVTSTELRHVRSYRGPCCLFACQSRESRLLKLKIPVHSFSGV